MSRETPEQVLASIVAGINSGDLDSLLQLYEPHDKAPGAQSEHEGQEQEPPGHSPLGGHAFLLSALGLYSFFSIDAPPSTGRGWLVYSKSSRSAMGCHHGVPVLSSSVTFGSYRVGSRSRGGAARGTLTNSLVSGSTMPSLSVASRSM